MSKPQWDDGVPQNLEAAAAEAGEWLDLIERLVMAGEWAFINADSLPRLRACARVFSTWNCSLRIQQRNKYEHRTKVPRADRMGD